MLYLWEIQMAREWGFEVWKDKETNTYTVCELPDWKFAIPLISGIPSRELAICVKNCLRDAVGKYDGQFEHLNDEEGFSEVMKRINEGREGFVYREDEQYNINGSRYDATHPT